MTPLPSCLLIALMVLSPVTGLKADTAPTTPPADAPAEQQQASVPANARMEAFLMSYIGDWSVAYQLLLPAPKGQEPKLVRLFTATQSYRELRQNGELLITCVTTGTDPSGKPVITEGLMYIEGQLLVLETRTVGNEAVIRTFVGALDETATGVEWRNTEDAESRERIYERFETLPSGSVRLHSSALQIVAGEKGETAFLLKGTGTRPSP